ncbi:MAG: M20/M25/M40 family metallo-hydrolase [Pirellulales bacterium]
MAHSRSKRSHQGTGDSSKEKSALQRSNSLKHARQSKPNGLTDAQATKLVLRLMAIPGRSGEEQKVAKFITNQLCRAGANPVAIRSDQAHQKTPIAGQTGNLVFEMPGTLRGPRRLLVAHMDTVPICVGAQPECHGQRVISSDPQTGLGADNRAGVGVLLSTALAILRQQLPHPPLTFLWTVQEEVGMQGARFVRLGLLKKPQLAFNWDGGSPEKLTIGATGGYRMKIDIRGRASHAGGAPEMGISAIAVASLAITDLVESGWHGLICKGKNRGTSNVGVISGGMATNVVTDHVTLRAEARSHDPKFRLRIVTAIEKAFTRAAGKIRSVDGACGQVEIDGRLEYESFRLATDDPSCVAAQHAIRAAGREPELAVANGGLDANWLTARGIPTVSLGCGQSNIHTVLEELQLDEFHRARQLALSLVTGSE